MAKSSASRVASSSLGAVDWERAALKAMAEGGPAAVAVEPLARRLGVTKGSFYWHFADRDALLRAALARWEADYTERVIEYLSETADPRERLTRLMSDTSIAKSAGRIHVALGSASKEPLVAAALARVSRRRVEFVEACYRGLGLDEDEARRWAVIAYSTYMGLIHLRAEAPAEIPQGDALEPYIETLIAAMIPASFDRPKRQRR